MSLIAGINQNVQKYRDILRGKRVAETDTSLSDGIHDHCGVVGIFNYPGAAYPACIGLHALQHRGQESAGIVTTHLNDLYVHHGMGHVADVFTNDILKTLPGSSSIGHVRYSTQGESHIKNAQPLVISCWRGPIALSHNGNLVNAHILRKELERKGSIFQSTNDSEVILHLIARSQEPKIEDAIRAITRDIQGAYSLILMTPSLMMGVRDPFGFRPLVIGRKCNSHILASETCALDLIGADFIRDLAPGELVLFDSQGIHSEFICEKPGTSAFCIFELIYFSRSDSVIFGQSVYDVRKRFGKQLALECPVEADVIIPVPDSGLAAALGLAEKLHIPLEMGFVRNHSVGRTFIEPYQSIRDFSIRIKLNPVRSVVAGRRILLVDDSIVRGTTTRSLIQMLRSVGAREVHVRIAAPPIIGSCRYGIDTPTENELIGARRSVSDICSSLGADSLGYLSISGMMDAIGRGQNQYCLACFNRQYPIPVIPDSSSNGDSCI